MTYPKYVEAQKDAEKTKSTWRTATKHYLESESFDEFKVKLAAEGLDRDGIGYMFAIHYMLHNTPDGNVHGIGLRSFGVAVASTLIVAAFLSLILMMFSASLWHVLWTLFVFPFAYVISVGIMDICNKMVEEEIRDAR